MDDVPNDWKAREKQLADVRYAQSIPAKTLQEFCREYEPPAYVLERIVRTNAVYTLTAKTGAGKTGFLTIFGLAVATGRRAVLETDVEPGRVCYIACENADDVRMRLIAACFLLNIDVREVGDRFVVIDRREKPEALALRLALDTEERGNFSLIIVDTLASIFDGTDINDNVQAGEFIRRLRPLTGLPGSPAVVIAAHPVKNAAEDNLLPYGGGAILNEVDGNLTLWRDIAGIAKLHWQGKIRGLEFEPPAFRFEITGSPDMLDVKGRQVQVPVMRPTTGEDADAKAAAAANVDIRVLRAMLAAPDDTIRDWATAADVPRSNLHRKLAALAKQGLVRCALNKWAVTPKGEKSLANV